MKRGLYRIHGTGDRPDDIRVDDDGIETPMAEPLYRTRGYLPLVDHLPGKTTTCVANNRRKLQAVPGSGLKQPPANRRDKSF